MLCMMLTGEDAEPKYVVFCKELQWFGCLAYLVK